MRRRLLPCVSPKVALRDILHARNNRVAFGVEADIDGRAGPAGSVANDPSATWTG
jgi:hypothetical protein